MNLTKPCGDSSPDDIAEDWSLFGFEHPDLTPEQIDAAVERQRERIEYRQLQEDADVLDARWS